MCVCVCVYVCLPGAEVSDLVSTLFDLCPLRPIAHKFIIYTQNYLQFFYNQTVQPTDWHKSPDVVHMTFDPNNIEDRPRIINTVYKGSKRVYMRTATEKPEERHSSSRYVRES